MSSPERKVSNTKIDAAGALIRTSLLDDGALSPQVDDAIEVIGAFRSSHSTVMDLVTQRVSEFGTTVIPGVPAVSNRLKRFRQMMMKLLARESMRLSQMSDIAGCRLIGGADDLALIAVQLRQHLEVIDEDDYREAPRSSGYRAHHIIVRQEGFRVEVQLRTPAEHAWAAWVEDISRSGRWGSPKDDRAHPDLLRALRRVSDALATGTMDADDFVQIRNEFLK